MNKQKHLSDSIYIDENSNKESSEEYSLHELLEIALKSGRLLFFGASYSVSQSQISNGDFHVRSYRRHKFLLRVLHFGFLIYLMVPFITERFTLSPCCLVNFIKKVLHVVLACSMLAGFYCVEIKGRKSCGLIPIFRQCVVLQKKFRSTGLHFPARKKVRVFGWTMSFIIFFICIIRQIVFSSKTTPWYKSYSVRVGRALTIGFWAPDKNTTTEQVHILLGTFGVIFDGMVANFWFFCQFFHFTCILTVWIVFRNLNQALKREHFQIKNLSDVIELHFQSIKLLNLMNRMVSPLTFWVMVFNIVCICFWTNYITVDFSLKFHYIAAVCFLLKTLVEVVLEADVNSKVHQITEWLEEACTSNQRFPFLDPVKIAIFTSQVYSKECTGFRGLHFFVVTPNLAIAVAGIVLMYTVAVNQLCHQSNKV